MHNVYLLLNPLKGLLNYLLMWYPWIVFLLLVVLVVRYFSLIAFFYQQVSSLIQQFFQMKEGRGKWVVSWYAETVKLYVSSFSVVQRSVFAQKIKYILLGCIFISWGWFMTSVLFWSFTTWWGSDSIEIGLDTSDMSQELFTKESTKLAKEELAYLTKEWVVNSDMGGVFEVKYISRINYTLWFVALYVFTCFVLAGFFFLISRGNVFLRNVGRFFVTLWILIFLSSIVLQLYVMQLWWAELNSI